MRRSGRLGVALVHEVFHGAGAEERLRAVLHEARRRTADLAVLPELPLDPWIPAASEPRDADVEEPGGPRASLLARLAGEIGIGVLGGAIVRDRLTRRRASRALVHDARGRLVASYDKLHLPREDGYWESAHYEPGEALPEIVPGFGLPVGVQLCSDVNRPTGSHLLAAAGAMAILVPRATPAESWERWRLVLRANALTTACWVVSVNRPRPEAGAAIGGPSIVIAPDGHVLHEATDPLTVVVLDADAAARARRAYPGYLDMPAALYARGWSQLAEIAASGRRDEANDERP
jgi:predicted amidohydrolase